MIIVLSAPKTAKLWKQERTIVNVPNMTTDVRLWTNLEGSADNPIAIYTPDGNGDVFIDVTDYLRAYPSVGTFNFSFGVNPPYSNRPLVVSSVGLINPEGVIIPDNPLAAYGALIIPPSMMICALDQSTPEDAEFYATSGTWSVTGSASIGGGQRSIGLIDGDFILSDGTHSKAYTPRGFRCGVRYALVRWVSFTGATRSHWFEVEKCKSTSKDTYDLLPFDNEYIQIKGREDGFNIHLEGLDCYDFWYYADVLLSSKVEVSFDGTNYDRVEVTTKSVTIPDGEAGTDGKLDISVNWKRYDAVAM